MSDVVVTHFYGIDAQNTPRWVFLAPQMVYDCICGYDGLKAKILRCMC